MGTERQHAKRILIAEDDAVSRRVLQAFLAKWGFEVTSAVDGAEAEQILSRKGAPTLAILDWMMPGIDGPELCRRVRGRTDRPYTYILLLTARTQKQDVFIGFESGADDYLTKPFDAQELRARLHVGQRILELQDNLIEAREKLRYQASHDPLTGVANHREIIDSIERESARQARQGGSFGIILFDLDHFKQVNDSYGHLAGDAVLQDVARRITANVRAYDMVGRYGGEEFLVVAPSSDAAGVLTLAERIRRAIGAAPYQTVAGTVAVTSSCGISIANSAHRIDSQSLIQKADEALYKAKGLGRNRSEIAKEPESTESLYDVPRALKPATH